LSIFVNVAILFSSKFCSSFGGLGWKLGAFDLDELGLIVALGAADMWFEYLRQPIKSRRGWRAKQFPNLGIMTDFLIPSLVIPISRHFL
jgi:hypothetical protein